EGQRKRLGAGGSAPSYKIALAALLSRLPDDFDRNGWLAISGAFASAVYGLPGSESAETDWLQWNASYPKDDQAADSRTWADFRRNGSNCGWPELRGMAHIERMDANDAGWMFFGGTAVVLPALAIATKPPALSQVTTDFVDIKGRPRVVARPLVDGVLPAASVGMLYGAPKAGKTFVTLDLALSVATEQQWNGHAVKRNAGPVVYIAGEGHKGLRYRVEAWEAERGATIERGRIRFTDAAISFGDRNALAALQSDLDALPVKPSLIVVDTLFRATVGANVNDQEQMSKFWQVCEQISRHYGCTVLVVHHTNKSESATSFGSIVSEASVDFQIAVEWDQGSRCIRSRLTKDDEPFDDICFNLKSVAVGFVEYDDGGAAVIQSCVPEYVQSSRSGNNRHENAGAKAIGKSMLRAPRSKDAATVLYIMARIQSVGQGSAVITKEQIRSALREGISDREPAHIIRDGTKSLLTSGHILPHKGRDDAWSIKDDAFILAREDNFGVYENYEPKL
ncbi:AAA family ATPase, partial [Mesorhizobium sp. M4B.F.Ca.ET.088.02.2.1]